MSVGIIVATEQELSKTKLLISEIQEHRYYNLIFYSGKINDKDIILVKCGVGKVNAARTTQILLDKFRIEYVINIGAAGATNMDLNIQDIIIGDKLVQYDFDLSALDDVPKGDIPGVGRFIKCDKNLIARCKETLSRLCDDNYKIVIGTIGTADLFCTDKSSALNVRNEFGAQCVEMEGAAIAQVCYLSEVPFVVIRGISDSPNGNNKVDYYTYCEAAAKQAAKFIKELI